MIGGGAPVFPDWETIHDYPYGTVGSGFWDVTGRTEVSAALTPGQDTGIYLCVGHSIQANQGGTPYTPVNSNAHQLNIKDGKVYRIKDPVLGQSGTAGGYMSKFADRMITAGMHDRTIMITTAKGGTKIAQFGPGGPLHHHMIAGALHARGYGWPLTAVLIDFGQNELLPPATSQAQAQAAYLAIEASLRGIGVTCPIVFAKDTWNGTASNPVIRAAADAVVSPPARRLGPDFDVFTGPTYRQVDGVHINDSGADAYELAWRTNLATWL